MNKMCDGKVFSFSFFKEKIKRIHKKLNLIDLSESYIIAAKLSIEVAKKMNEFNEKSMSKDGFVGQAWIILMMIYSSEEELCAIDLCDHLGQSKATVSRIIESLKDKNLIDEIENKVDRRKYNLVITPAGENYIKEKIQEHKHFYNEIFKNVDIEKLNPEMLKLLENINNYKGV